VDEIKDNDKKDEDHEVTCHEIWSTLFDDNPYPSRANNNMWTFKLDLEFWISEAEHEIRRSRSETAADNNNTSCMGSMCSCITVCRSPHVNADVMDDQMNDDFDDNVISESHLQIIVGPEESKEQLHSRGSLFLMADDQSAAERLEDIKRRSISQLKKMSILRRTSLAAIISKEAAMRAMEETRKAARRSTILQLKRLGSIMGTVDNIEAINRRNSLLASFKSTIHQLDDKPQKDDADPQLTPGGNHDKDSNHDDKGNIDKNIDKNISRVCAQDSEDGVIEANGPISHTLDVKCNSIRKEASMPVDKLEDLLAVYAKHNSIQFFHRGFTSEFWFKVSEHRAYEMFLYLYTLYLFSNSFFSTNANLPGGISLVVSTTFVALAEASQLDLKVVNMNLRSWDSIWMLFNVFLFVITDTVSRIGSRLSSSVNTVTKTITSNFTLCVILFFYVNADASARTSKKSSFVRMWIQFCATAYFFWQLFGVQLCNNQRPDGTIVDLYAYSLYGFSLMEIWKASIVNILVFSIKMLVMSYISPYAKLTLQSPVYMR
jgi:hypothetical protein